MLSQVNVLARLEGSYQCGTLDLSADVRALQFGLGKLKAEARQALEARLSERNIVKEMFSDFTWRYVRSRFVNG